MVKIKNLETKELTAQVIKGKVKPNIKAWKRAAELAELIRAGDDSELSQDAIWREAQQVAQELQADIDAAQALRGALHVHFQGLQQFAGGEYFRRMRGG